MKQFKRSLYVSAAVILAATQYLAAASIAYASDKNSPIDFAQQIRPILAANCFACHGADSGSREAGLRLDTPEGAVAKLESGEQAIVPGKHSEGEFYKRISSKDPDEIMPPADSGHTLKPEEIELLGRWVDEGAKYTKHWAFIAPKKTAVPAVKDASKVRNEIDPFVIAKLTEKNLQLAQAADRHTLARRLSLDLIGLPPSPSEVNAFVNDKSPNAYEKYVDRLLASPRYGEHWARLWLDLARYADTQGYEKDNHRDIWAYRDWVIDALNRDLPYDQFTIEQLAGDLLPNAKPNQILATAFHRNTMTNTEGGTDDEEFRTLAVKDRIETTMQVWMGLTMQCSNCHSHKYDPVSQEEYYQFLAFFNQTEDADRGNDTPRANLPTPEQQQQIDKLKAEVATLEKLSAASPQVKAVNAKKIADLKNQLKAIKPPSTPVMRELAANKRRKTHINIRGSFLDKGKEVSPAVPAAFHPMDESAPQSRLGVAKWLVDRKNPLTARVHVNRIWARIFGRGIVETEEDFGTQGMLPSHPKLLDWLAIEWMERHGWSQKKLLKQLVMSATYRQSAVFEKSKLLADPQNRLFSRGPRFRLSAEVVRDQALAAAGLLSSKMYGKSVMPPQPPGIWQAVYNHSKWTTSKGEDRYRRGLYTYIRRTSPYPAMITFDAGSREVCMLRRVRTNTPLQALVTLNDPVYVEAAAALGKQMLSKEKATAGQGAAYGFRLLLTRSPEPAEIDRLKKMHADALAHFKENPASATELLNSANSQVAADADAVEWAAWTIVANVLLNLDETLMKG